MMISIPFLVGSALSLFLFLFVTQFLRSRNLFKDLGTGMLSGLNYVFVAAGYAIFWACPTLLGWAIYATWFA